MLKKILLGLLVVLACYSLYIGYTYFIIVKTQGHEPVESIPQNAAIIITGNNASSLWSKLAHTNLMWEELRRTEIFLEIDNMGKFIDSIAKEDLILTKLTKNNTCAISAHLTGGRIYNFLFTLMLPTSVSEQEVADAIKTHTTITSLPPFENISISSFNTPRGTCYYILQNRTLSICFSKILIEDVVRTQTNGKTISNTKWYKSVSKLNSADAEANLVVNFKYFPNVIGTYFNLEAKIATKPLLHFAQAVSLDITLTTNGILLNGFMHTADSSANYLNALKGQSPQSSGITELLPYNTAFFIQHRFSDAEMFFKNYTFFLANSAALQKREAELAELNSKCGCNILSYILSWVGKEITVAGTEATAENLGYRYAIISPNNEKNALERLNALSLLLAEKTETTSYQSWIDDRVIGQIPIENIFSAVMGSTFSEIHSPYYTSVKGRIVMSNSEEGMRYLLKNIQREKTLLQSQSYNSFDENLSDEANIFLYSNTARSPYIYRQFLSDSMADALDSNISTFRNFDAVAVQISNYKNGLFLTNIYAKYNPVYKEETATLWEAQLDTSMMGKPWIVTNHNTGNKEVIVQDSNFNIYQISTTGKILWKYALDGKILGPITQLDVYKNNKLQLFLNTPNSLYIIDRLGRNIPGFPVKLSNQASVGAGVVDYDKNKNYRILVPCTNGMVYNYDTQGKNIEGWAFSGSAYPIISTPKYFSIHGKDFLFFADEKGSIFLLNRKGEVRYSSPGHIIGKSRFSDLFIETANEISQTRVVYSDTTGKVMRLQIDGLLTSKALLPLRNNHKFLFADNDGDGINDYIFTDSTFLYVYGADGIMKYTQEFDTVITSAIIYFSNSGKGCIGIVQPTQNKIFLFNSEGEIMGNMPFEGNTLFNVSDINKDGTLNIVVGKGSTVFAYNLN